MMTLRKNSTHLSKQIKLLSTLTLGHGTNDFYSVLLPVLLPVIAQEFQLSYTQFGLILLFTTITSGILQPLFGYIADRFGIQKQLIMLGFLMFALGLAGFSIATTFLALVLSSLIYGFGETTFHAQSTNFITSIFAENKGRAMGIHGL
ncbi:MAG: MFS transporter, partial [Chloroflexota bacterium]